jgi:putative toxin-antitoxin system antitoxin component (TIGR02293 family)
MSNELNYIELFGSYDSILEIEKQNFQQKIDLVKKGITKRQLSKFRRVTDLDWISICRLLGVAGSTLQLKKEDERLNPRISDRIFAIAEIYCLGYTIYEDRKKFNRWMKRKNAYLIGKRPIEIMDTLPGMAEVKMEIRRIAFGIS